jgi:hypothetical protein
MHLDDAQSLPKLQESHPSQGLSEHISQLLLGPDMIDLHLALLNALMNKVIFSVYMLTHVMMHRVFT